MPASGRDERGRAPVRFALSDVEGQRERSVFDSLGLAEPAALLAGVVLHGPLAVLSILPRAELDDRAVLLKRMRTLIGRTAYERAIAQGVAMNDNEAVIYALEQLETAEVQSLAPVPGT